jgi:hypothetical protein
LHVDGNDGWPLDFRQDYCLASGDVPLSTDENRRFHKLAPFVRQNQRPLSEIAILQQLVPIHAFGALTNEPFSLVSAATAAIRFQL